MEAVTPDQMIRLSKSCIGDAEKQAVMGVLEREFLGMGAEVQQFEQALEDFFGRPAVCVVNGTAALHLALQACGIGHGDEVLVQSLTYVASYQAISATGAIPIACDINPFTLTLDWRDAEKRLTPRTRAVMPVHYSGGVGALDEIYAFANTHGLRVIEDAAHAFGTVYQGKRVGGFGDIACFSFDGIKNITSGEGGCIVTDDEEVLRLVKDARLLGVEKDTDKRYSGQRSWEFDVTTQGWRYHMSNIMAAIGIEQLKRFSEFANKRQNSARYYSHLLSSNPHVNLLDCNYTYTVPHIYPVILSDHIDRSLLQSSLMSLGIQTGTQYFPNHKLSMFSSSSFLPFTNSLSNRILTLPLHPELLDEEILFIVSSLCSFISNNT